MLYLAYISFLFLTIQLINVLINLVFRQKIKPSKGKIEAMVSVLIPARNEEENIAFLLSDIRKIKNRNLEILVFDDQSTDNTVKVVQGFSEKDARIKLLKPYNLSLGWLGKNHACYQLAQKAIGKHYLFIDADVRINGNVIMDAVAYSRKYDLDLLSIFPTQIQKTLVEKLSVPIMNYILLTLLPLIFVRISKFKSHAAANGQFMLFRAKTYDKIQPHKLFKDSGVEDIAIAQFFKKQKKNIACITSEKRVRCRMYKTYYESVAGFSKNVFMFFGNKPVLAFVFWLFSALGFIPVLIIIPEYILIFIVGTVLIQIIYSVVSKQNVILNTLFFPFHLFFLLQILVKGILVKAKKKYSWKGRYIYS